MKADIQARRHPGTPASGASAMLKTAPDPQAVDKTAEDKPRAPVDPRKGTETLPMPDQSKQVAGMPRDGRAIAQPGEPGVIPPEDDVLDTSYENRKG